MFGRGEIRDGPEHTPVCVRCGHEWYLHKSINPPEAEPIVYRCFFQWEDKLLSRFQYCGCEGSHSTISLGELRNRIEMGWQPEDRGWLEAQDAVNRPGGDVGRAPESE